MNINKKIFFILLFVLLLSVNAVSAFDNSTSDSVYKTEHEVSDEVIITEIEKNIDNNYIENNIKKNVDNKEFKTENGTIEPKKVVNKTITKNDTITSNTIYENVLINAPIIDVTNISVIDSTITFNGTPYYYLCSGINNSNFINTTIRYLLLDDLDPIYVNNTFINVTFIDARFYCKIDNATFINSTFINSSLHNIMLDGVNVGYIDNSIFKNVSFVSSTFEGGKLFENCNFTDTHMINSYFNDVYSNNTTFNNIILNHTRYSIGSMNYTFVDETYINSIENTVFNNVTYVNNFLDDYEFNIEISEQELTTGEIQHITGNIKRNSELLKNADINIILEYKEDSDAHYEINEHLITKWTTNDKGEFDYQYVPTEHDLTFVPDDRTVKIKIEYLDEFNESYYILSDRFKIKSIYEGYVFNSNISKKVFSFGDVLKADAVLTKDNMPLKNKTINVIVEERFDGLEGIYLDDSNSTIPKYAIYSTELVTDENGNIHFEYNITKNMIGYYDIEFKYVVDDFRSFYTGDSFDVKNHVLTVELINSTYSTGDTIYIKGNLTHFNVPVKEAAININFTYHAYDGFIKLYNRTVTVWTDDYGVFTFNYTVPSKFDGDCWVTVYVDVGYFRLRGRLETQTYSQEMKYYANNTLIEPFLTVNVQNKTIITNNPYFTVSGKLFDSNGPITNQTIHISQNWGYYHVQTDENGEYCANVSAIDTFHGDGIWDLDVMYNGNEIYKPITNSTSINILKPAYLTAKIQSYYIRKGDEIIITGQLYDYNNDKLKNKTVTINIDNQEFYVNTDSNGEYISKIPTDNIPLGSYNIKVMYNDTNNVSETKVEYCEVLLLKKTILTIEDVNLTYRLNFRGKLTDENGNPLKNASIWRIDYSGLPTITDENGTFSSTIPDFWINEYIENDIAKLFFAGNTTHSYSEICLNITDLKPNTRIDIETAKTISYENITLIKFILSFTNDNTTYNILANQNMQININNETFNVTTDYNGEYSLQYNPKLGINNITALYKGNKMYKQSNATSNFSVNKLSTILTVGSRENADVGTQMSIYGKLTDKNGKDLPYQEILINVDGKTYNTTTTQYGNYRIPFTASNPGMMTITATYAGTNTYINSNATSNFSVNKLSTILTVGSRENVVVGTQMSVYGKLTDKDGKDLPFQEILINVDGKTYNTTTTQYGNYRIPFTASNPGMMTITATYAGTNTYINSNATSNFSVNKLSTILTVGSRENVDVGTKMSIYGKLTDQNGKDLAYQQIQITLDGNTYTTTTTQYGNYKIQITPLTSGSKTITSIYDGSNIYNGASASSTFIVNKQDTILTVGSRENVLAGTKMSIYGKLTDKNSKDLAYQQIQITLDGNTYTTTTTQYGNYKIQITPQTPGNKSITATYKGTDTYNKATATSTFITQQDSILTVGSSKTVLVGNKMSIYGKLTDKNGKDLAYQQIQITVDGNTYSTTTTQYGNYKIQFTPQTQGSKTITATYKGSNVYNNATVSSTFKANKQSCVVTVGSSSTIKMGSIMSIYGKLSSNGVDMPYQQVIVTIDGKTYYQTTNQYGNYNFKISPTTLGIKTIVATYGGTNIYVDSRATSTFEVIRA